MNCSHGTELGVVLTKPEQVAALEQQGKLKNKCLVPLP